MEIGDYNEKNLQPHAQELLASIDVQMVGSYNLCLGSRKDAFKIDALGVDAHGLLVVELKCKRDKGVIGNAHIAFSQVDGKRWLA